MTEKESIAEVAHLANLYPRSNEDQLGYWRLKFLKYESPKVRVAVLKFFDSDHVGFIDKTGLLAIIESEHGRGPLPPDRRAEAAVREAESIRFHERQLAEKAKTSFSDVDFILRDLSDEELQDLKSGTLECLSADTAKFLARSDIRTGKTLRWHMANRLRGFPVG